MKHCDDYIHDLSAPPCLRWFLFVNRLPASDRMLLVQHTKEPSLYAYYDGKKCRVVMASRFGDVGINFTMSETGYEKRVPISELAGFSPHRL